jgi:hypothetical protein
VKFGSGLSNQVGTELARLTSLMKECPHCRELFDPEPTSGEFYPDCADAIRDEFGLCALLQRM